MSLDTALARKLQRVMQQEIRRSLKGLRLPGHPRPFFLSYMARAGEGLHVWGRFGAVFGRPAAG